MGISVEEIKRMDKSTYQMIDIRSQIEMDHGAIEGAVAIRPEEIENSEKTDASKKLIICCSRGIVSNEVAERLREKGLDAQSLDGGYNAWLMDRIREAQKQDKAEEVEQSLRKKFKKTIWSKFTKAVTTYELVKPGDAIAVCISGGKDSMLMAKCFQELKLHNKFDFEVKFLVMDPGYSAANRRIIEENARNLNIPITVFESDIFDSVYHVEKSPCYLCARMRRGHLYHFKAWRDYNGLHFIQCACKFTDTCSTCNHEENRSKRMEIKELIRTLKQSNPYVEGNIFKSVENVNLDTVVAYKKNGEKHTFLEGYDTE